MGNVRHVSADLYTADRLRHPDPQDQQPIGEVDPTGDAFVNPNPIPPTSGGSIQFSFAPSSAVVAWTDGNGSFTGNLAKFNSSADMATVTTLNFDGAGVTSIDGPFSALPSLVNLNLDNNPGLASVAPIPQMIVHFSFSNGGATGVAIVFTADLNVSGETSYIRFINNPGIVSVTTPNGTDSFDGEITFDNCAALVTQQLSPLQHYTFTLQNCASLVSGEASMIETLTINVVGNPLLESFTFVRPGSFRGLHVDGNDKLSSVDLTGLVTIQGGDGVTITGNSLMTSIQIPDVAVGDSFSDTTLDFSSNPALTTLNLTGMHLNWDNGGSTLIASGCALSQASVDGILHMAVLSGISSGTIDLSGGTNAAPSGAGAADAATLTGLGVNVITN